MFNVKLFYYYFNRWTCDDLSTLYYRCSNHLLCNFLYNHLHILPLHAVVMITKCMTLLLSMTILLGLLESLSYLIKVIIPQLALGKKGLSTLSDVLEELSYERFYF